MSSFLTRKQRKKYGILRNQSRPDSSSYSAFERTLDTGDAFGGTVYVFDSCQDTDEYELLQVRDRGATSDSRSPNTINGHTPNYIEKKIRSDDSLASLALRYGCPVAELKRVNNLISDQEFHALRKIKVPVKPYSLLTEQLSNDEKPSAQLSDRSLNSDEDTPEVKVRTIAIGDSLLSGPTEAFLRHMDEDLERIRKATCQYKSSLQEVAAELTCKRFHPFREQTDTTSHVIPLRALLVIGALITLIVPIVIIILELQKDKHSP